MRSRGIGWRQTRRSFDDHALSRRRPPWIDLDRVSRILLAVLPFAPKRGTENGAACKMRLARVCSDCALLRTLLVMMRAKERGRWEIAANHNVRLPGALTGKRRRETSLDSKATQLQGGATKKRDGSFSTEAAGSATQPHFRFAPKADARSL